MTPRRISAMLVVLAAGCVSHDPNPKRVGGQPLPEGGVDATTSVTWCEAREVLAAKCWCCHVDPPLNGAPFPLLSYEDTQAVFYDDIRVHERMKAAVESDFMPPLSLFPDLDLEPLTAAEKATLLSWLGAGAPLVGSADCPAPPARCGQAAGGAGGSTGSGQSAGFAGKGGG